MQSLAGPRSSRQWYNIQGLSSGRHALIGCFLWGMNRLHEVEDANKEQWAPAKLCVCLNSCIKLLLTQQREKKSILTHATSRQHRVHSTMKKEKEKRWGTKHEEHKTAIRHMLKVNAVAVVQFPYFPKRTMMFFLCITVTFFCWILLLIPQKQNLPVHL